MVRFKVNGTEETYDGDPEMPLLWYLRDVAGFTGTKFGCGMALCGACTVHKDGEAVRSCSVAMKDVERSEHHDHRGRIRQGIAPRAKGLDGDQGSAMRILPDGTDHAGHRFSEPES